MAQFYLFAIACYCDIQPGKIPFQENATPLKLEPRLVTSSSSPWANVQVAPLLQLPSVKCLHILVFRKRESPIMAIPKARSQQIETEAAHMMQGQ